MRLTGAMCATLRALFDDSPLPAAELADVLKTPLSTVQGRLRRAVDAGWVTRVNEWGAYTYELTDAGRAVVEGGGR